MNYLLVLSIAFILLNYSNFINLRYKIKLHETFLITICAIIIFSFLLLKLEVYFDFTLLNYSLIILLLPTFFLLPYIIKNNFEINKKLNLEFILIFFFIFFLSKDRYYLDQDEFTYWGLALKALPLNFDEINFKHHPDGLNLFRNLFTFIEYDEGIIIFSNNIIIISTFYYLFYDRKLSIHEKIILFLIYYLLLNNLSFGFLSIYSDPILAVLYACLLKKSFLMFKNKNSKKEFTFLLIFFTLLLVNRSAPIYAISIFCFCLGLFFLTLNKRSSKSLYLFLFTLVISTIVIYNFFLPVILTGNYELDKILANLFSNNFYYKQLINLLISPIYFSSFGVTLNGILDIIFSLNFRIYEFKIPLIIYILFLLPFFFLKFQYKWFILISSIFIIVAYMIIVLVVKVGIDNLHLSSIPRYIGILILAKYLFIISIIVFNNQHIHKNFIFLIFLLMMFSVTPKKTLGFFASNDIYYKSISNKNFKKNRENISKLKEIKNNYDKFLVVHKENFSDLTNINISGEHSFYHNIIEYELFPEKAKFIEFENYLLLKNNIKEKNTLKILFDLPLSDILKINNIDNNFFEIKTY